MRQQYPIQLGHLRKYFYASTTPISDPHGVVLVEFYIPDIVDACLNSLCSKFIKIASVLTYSYLCVSYFIRCPIYTTSIVVTIVLNDLIK